MSMINQMLKDLDSRQGKASEAQPMLTDVRLSPKPARNLVKPIGLGLLAVAIGFALFARFRQVQAPATAVDNPPVVPGVAPVVAVPMQPGLVVSAPTATTEAAAAPIAPTPQTGPTVKAANSSAASTPLPVAKPTTGGAGEDSPERALQRWQAAYSTGDAKAYLNSYAPDFVPSNDLSLAKWQQQRRDFFARGRKAKIDITDLKIEANGAVVKTHFHQSFRSTGYNDDVNKTLSWRQIDGTWLIVAEISRPIKPATALVPVKDSETADTQVPETPRKAAQKLPATKAASIKSVNPKQLSANLYRDAVTMVQEGHLTEAQATLTQSLDANPANHSARQMLADLMVDAGRRREATALLSNGLSLVPGHSGFCIALARLHLASGAKQEAFTVLQQGLSNAGDDGEYHGFFAALLQTLGRHEEAIKHYVIALRSDPSMPSWLVGIGISLRTQKKLVDAAEAFQRALNTGELSVEVADFVRQQIEQIRRSR